MKKNGVKIIIVIAAVFLLVGIVEMVIFSRKEKDNNPDTSKLQSHYDFSEKVEERPGTQKYSSETLSASHCLDGICVENATFYYTDAGGRLEYTLMNQTNETASGLLKMVFDKQSLIIAYQDLAPGAKVETSSYYTNKTIEKMEDYHLEHLSEEDNKKIVYTK